HAWCEIPAGTFMMGNDGADAIPGDGEGPARRVMLDAFRIAATTVTNAQFGAFVRATRYVTEAERRGRSYAYYLQLPAAQRGLAANSRIVRWRDGGPDRWTRRGESRTGSASSTCAETCGSGAPTRATS